MSESAIDKLIAISSELRRRCPWDRRQTLSSLSPFIIEETYELIDAVSSEKIHKVKEELGDLLYLIMLCFHICREEHGFGIDEVADETVKKMAGRHPSLFSADGSGEDTSELSTWYRLKQEKRGTRKRFSEIPESLPALFRAAKVQEVASALGFDWEDTSGVMEKIDEELAELKRALSGKGDVEHELGDLLFSLVNLSRFIQVNAELALRSSIQRFCRRFSLMEEELAKRGIQIKEASMEEMDAIWDSLK